MEEYDSEDLDEEDYEQDEGSIGEDCLSDDGSESEGNSKDSSDSFDEDGNIIHEDAEITCHYHWVGVHHEITFYADDREMLGWERYTTDDPLKRRNHYDVINHNHYQLCFLSSREEAWDFWQMDAEDIMMGCIFVPLTRMFVRHPILDWYDMETETFSELKYNFYNWEYMMRQGIKAYEITLMKRLLYSIVDKLKGGCEMQKGDVVGADQEEYMVICDELNALQRMGGEERRKTLKKIQKDRKREYDIQVRRQKRDKDQLEAQGKACLLLRELQIAEEKKIKGGGVESILKRTGKPESGKMSDAFIVKF